MRKHSLTDTEYRRVEVITGKKRRREWTAEEKADILAATMAAGATVTEVARRFSVSPALLFATGEYEAVHYATTEWPLWLFGRDVSNDFAQGRCLLAERVAKGARIPMKSAMHSNSKSASDSDLKPARYSDLMSAT